MSVLRLVSVISFRYSVVSGLNPNELEPNYYQATRAIIEGTARTPAAIFERLRPIYVDDAKFRQDLTSFAIETSGQRKRLAKYILATLEGDLSRRECDPDTDPGTIEHILPENPSETWEDVFPRARWDEEVYRLGNLTLLEPALNRRVGNATYTEKVSAYAESAYALTRSIPDLAPEEWTFALLEERQRRLATRAVHVWRVDF